MEKDDELKGSGNSLDYGARMYDSRIGRWFSRDNLEEKYPWLSTYSYTANNPIMNKEIDGQDWTVSTLKDEESGNTIIVITLDAAVVNTSTDQSLDMQGLADATKSQIQASYSMTYKNEDGTTTTVEATVNIRVVNDVSEIKNNEHAVQVVNPGEYGVGTGYGRGPFNGNQLYLNKNMVPGMIDGSDNNTIPHELGHTAGLKHADRPTHMTFDDAIDGQEFTPCTPCVEDNVDNAMYSGYNPSIKGTYLDDKTSTEINPDQIKVIKKNADNGELNKDTRGK
jgi:RHS repeat-associated protein